jgi:carbon monoxide dehydrogenase subunit G
MDYKMPIRYRYSETVRATPERAFAVIDDLALTAKWLPPCVSLEKLAPGPNCPGDKLRYVYRHGRKTAEMAGEIVARTPGERVHCRYSDGTFEVSVDLRVAAAAGKALTTHVIEITPKRLFARLFSPLIRLGLEKQTREAARNLKRLLESEANQLAAQHA